MRLLGSKSLLLCCGFLFVFTETVLSPFYPQFFQQVFGRTDLALTGNYVATCRLTVLLAAPLWGLLARRIDAIKLLIIGQSMAAILTACLSLATNLTVFFTLTIALLLFKSSYFLFYSALIALQGKAQQAQTVGQVQLVVHLALIASTLASAWVLSFEHPLQLFLLVAVLDVVQVMLCVMVLRQRKTLKPVQLQATEPVLEKPQGWPFTTIMGYGLLVLAFSMATNAVRPYLTAYSMNVMQLDRLQSAWLYLLPSLMALCAYPLLKSKWLHQHSFEQRYAVLLGLLVMSLLGQALASHISLLFLARMLFGLSLLLAQTQLELYLFQNAAHSPHWYFSLASTTQHAGQLLAPLAAALVVGIYGLAAPFWLAAFILLLSFIFIAVGLNDRPVSRRSIAHDRGIITN
ncbi:MFS transporter [Alkanindiges illinoisensis]|uniref:MFS transporter n=1 Tax=Alkanindiges illinoisensis TaxID=197183 RepID=UPI000687F5FF|nr:MFS transporter [Alkanindiges illinoisensis]